MKIEVIKIIDVELNGSKATIVSIEDFKRLCFEYRMKLSTWTEMGLSRQLWDNTILCHNLTRDDIKIFRETKTEHKKLHLNSTHGFNKEVSLSNSYPNNSKVNKQLAILEDISPGITHEWVSNLNNKGITDLSFKFLQLSLKLLEYRVILKRLRGRIRKSAMNRGLPYFRSIVNITEYRVAMMLNELGIEFLPQLYIKPYHYDFYLPKANMVIEVDGGGHNTKDDKNKENKLKSKKISLLRVRDINEANYDTIKDSISKEYRSKTNS